MSEDKPICPKCDKSSNMVLYGYEWVCHSTHAIDRFQEWWEEEGKKAAYPMDIYSAERLARLAWNRSSS